MAKAGLGIMGEVVKGGWVPLSGGYSGIIFTNLLMTIKSYPSQPLSRPTEVKVNVYWLLAWPLDSSAALVISDSFHCGYLPKHIRDFMENTWLGPEIHQWVKVSVYQQCSILPLLLGGRISSCVSCVPSCVLMRRHREWVFLAFPQYMFMVYHVLEHAQCEYSHSINCSFSWCTFRIVELSPVPIYDVLSDRVKTT